MKSSDMLRTLALVLVLAIVGILGIILFHPSSPVASISSRSQTAQVSGATPCAIVCNGLVGYWPFDEGQGTVAHDTSASADNGTLVNGPAWTQGKVGSGALSLNGTSQYISTPSDISGTGAATFSAWIYPTAWGPQKDIIAAQQGALEFFVETSYPATMGFVSLSDNGGTNKCSSAGTLSLNAWYLVTATRDASGNCILYINGTQVSSGSSGAPVAGTALDIGSRTQAGFYFSGTIDDVRIYNRVLASSEVASLYSNGSGGGSSSGGSPAPSPSTYTLTLTNGTNGTVTSNPSGLICNSPGLISGSGSTCTMSNLTSGTQVTLTATPNSGYTTSWSGCTSSNGNTCTISIGSANASVTVAFTQSSSAPAPTISSVSASAITANGATIAWTTNTNTSSQVAYGLTTAYGSQTALNSTLTQSHSVSISGLSANTAYYYSAESVDVSGNSVQSASGATFTTLPSSSSPPPSPPSGTTTYWVSPNGTAAWSACSGSTPLNGSAACPLYITTYNAKAGDTVEMRGGTYNAQLLNPTNSGTVGNPITFTAYNGEDVEMTSEFIPDRSMETSAWPAYNGASVSRSSAEAWDGSYSSKFSTTASGQGIQSAPFSLAYGNDNLYACVYSNQSLVHLEIMDGSGSNPMYNKDVAIAPNLWSCFSTSYITGATGNQANVIFSSPASIPAGTWYVDDVRMHSYEALINLVAKNYIKILGVHVSDADQGFQLENGASYNEIANSTFTNLDAYSPGVITGFLPGPTLTGGSEYNWIHNDVFHDNGYVETTGASACFEVGDQLRIGESNTDDNSDYNLVEDNLFYHTIHDSVQIQTQHNTVRDNVFHNEVWFPNHYATVSKATFEDAFSPQSPSYGDTIFNWLQQNNYLDSAGHVIHTWGVTIDNGGSGYAVGSVLYIRQSGAYNGTVTVASVGPGGVITALVPTPTTNGSGYTYGTNIPLTTTGSGPTVNIVDTITAYFSDPGEAAAIHTILGDYDACGLGDPEPDISGRDIIMEQPPNSTDDDAGYNFIEDNRIGFAGTPITEGANGIENAANGNIIRYNYFYKADASGYEFKPPSTGVNPPFPSYNHIFNNTFYDNGGGQSILLAKQGAFQLYNNSATIGDPRNPVGNIMINNIMYGNTADYAGIGSAAFEADGNTISNNSFEKNNDANPLFSDPDVSNPSSLTLPDLTIQAGSPDIDAGMPLTNVSTNSVSGTDTTLAVNDAGYFQDGTWAPPGHLQADWIAVGTVNNVAQISSINYNTDTITLVSPIIHHPGDSVWLYKDSNGNQVLYGNAPDIGADEYCASNCQPTNSGSVPATSGQSPVSPPANTAPPVTTAPPPTTTPTVPSTSGTFSVGESVEVYNAPTTGLNVRSSPTVSAPTVNGSPEADGNTGTIAAAPSGTTNGVSADGYSWWYVAYANNVVGWSAEAYLEAYTASAPYTPPVSNTSSAPSGGGGASSLGGGGGGSYVPPTAVTSTLPPVVSNSIPAAAPASGSGTPWWSIPSPLLSLPYGSRSSSVASLQTSLINDGYLAQGLATGYYGPLTQAALTTYLEETGGGGAPVPSSGISAAITSNASPASTSGLPSVSAPSTFTGSFTRTLTPGSTGPDVQGLQVFLNSHGFIVSSSGAGSPGNETDYFGPATKSALIRFQQTYAPEILAPLGLTQGTGNFGTATMKEVNGLLGN